jgi:hypothetical protein
MKKLFPFLIFLGMAFACDQELVQPESPAVKNEAAVTTLAAAAATPKEMIVCDQKGGRIAIVDINNANKITWEWKASGAYAQIRSGAQGWFSNLSEAKLVYGGKYILTCASGGGVALINISSKKAIWFDYAGGNTHSAEILPNGNIVTASTDGYLMIFTVDSYINDESAQSGKITFADVHNVVWDNKNKVLWAAGKNLLKSFTYNNSCRNPGLTLKKTYTMPQGNAHDLFPVYGSTTELWLSNSNHAYKFDVVSGKFTLVKNSQGKTLAKVKSISSGPTGYPTIFAVANGTGGESWRTNSITNLEGGNVFKNTAFGMYKARWRVINSFSYPASDGFRECTH